MEDSIKVTRVSKTYFVIEPNLVLRTESITKLSKISFLNLFKIQKLKIKILIKKMRCKTLISC